MSDSTENSDEKEIESKLKYFIAEFKKFKNSKGAVASKIFIRLADLQKYIGTIELHPLNRKQLLNSIDYVDNAVSLGIGSTSYNKKLIDHINRAIDELNEMLLFLIENPTINPTINLKSF